MWIHRYPLNNSLVVFIHGIFGSKWTTWTSYVEYFQSLDRESALLQSYDIYLFNYATRALRQSPFENVVSQLKTFLDGHRDRYQTVVLVCHSQGGIIGKQYILNELTEGRGLGLKIDMIITLSTPHFGSWTLNVLAPLRMIPFFARRRVLRQAADLGSWSPNIHNLRKNWNKSYVSPTPIAPGRKRRYIRSVAFSGLKDRFVSNASAEGFLIDEKDDVVSGHSVDSWAVVNRLARFYLERHEDPLALETQFKRERAGPNRARFEQGLIGEATAIVRQDVENPPVHYVSARATCCTEELGILLRRHPLRKLSLLEAFRAYVRRIIGG